MTSLAQNQEFEQRKISATLQRFYSDYRIAALLRACRGEKQKGISAFRIFQYLLCLVFSGRSMYMQLVTGRFAEMFSKNTIVYPGVDASAHKRRGQLSCQKLHIRRAGNHLRLGQGG